VCVVSVAVKTMPSAVHWFGSVWVAAAATVLDCPTSTSSTYSSTNPGRSRHSSASTT
jgi:hypothetical protein